MSSAYEFKNPFEDNPALQAYREKALANFSSSKNTEPEKTELPSFEMGSTKAPLVEFTESTLDDGAKSRLKSSASIVDLYVQWFSPSNVGKATDRSCLVNCCNSGAHSHGDANPTMDLSSWNNTFTCRGCEWNGDIIDLAAVSAGLISPGQNCPDTLIPEAVMYGCKSAFPDMADGWKQVGEKNTWIYDPTPEIDYNSLNDIEEITINKPGIYAPTFDWETLLPHNTGIRRNMELFKDADMPEEFGIPVWMGIVTNIIGRDIVLKGKVKDYVCLFYILLIARPNTGKSLSWELMFDALEDNMRYNPYEADSRTVKKINDISSGEILVQSLDCQTIAQPNLSAQGQTTQKHVPEVQKNIRCIGYYDEYETYFSKVRIQNSTLANKFTTAWPGYGSTLSEHSRGKRPTDVNDYFLSLFSATPSNKVKEFIEPKDIKSGLPSRWCYVYSDKEPHEDVNEFDGDTFNDIEYVKNIRPWIQQLIKYRDDRIKTGKTRTTFTKEALDEFAEFKKSTILPTMRGASNELFVDMFQRVEILFIRFCMFYSFSLLEEKISITSVRLAEHHFMWHISNVERVLGTLSDISAEISDYLTNCVIRRAKTDKGKTPNPIRHSELLRYGRDKYSGQVTDETLERLIANLVRGGTILKVNLNENNKSKVGRPAWRYIPNG